MRKVWLVEFVNENGVEELRTCYSVSEVIDFACGKVCFYRKIVDLFCVDMEVREIKQQVLKFDGGFVVEDKKDYVGGFTYIADTDNVKLIDINQMYPMNEETKKIKLKLNSMYGKYVENRNIEGLNVILDEINRFSECIRLLGTYGKCQISASLYLKFKEYLDSQKIKYRGEADNVSFMITVMLI